MEEVTTTPDGARQIREEFLVRVAGRQGSRTSVAGTTTHQGIIDSFRTEAPHQANVTAMETVEEDHPHATTEEGLEMRGRQWEVAVTDLMVRRSRATDLEVVDKEEEEAGLMGRRHREILEDRRHKEEVMGRHRKIMGHHPADQHTAVS